MTIVPRLWVGPDGETLDCDEMDMSHALGVVTYPERFGLSCFADRLRESFESDDFDFDLVIALAERAGWARVSRDATAASTVAISAATPRAAARAVGVLSRHHGIVAARIDVEISLVADGRLLQTYHEVEGSDVRSFERYARLPSSALTAMRPVPSWVVDTMEIPEGKKRCAR